MLIRKYDHQGSTIPLKILIIRHIILRIVLVMNQCMWDSTPVTLTAYHHLHEDMCTVMIAQTHVYMHAREGAVR